MSVARKLVLCTLTVCGVVIYLGHERITHLTPEPAPASPAPSPEAPAEPPKPPSIPAEPPTSDLNVPPIPNTANDPGAGNLPPLPPIVETPISVLSTGLSMKADREGDFNGCKDGTLTLAESELVFTCGSNAKRSVRLRTVDIQETDRNGVKRGRDNYHFDIHGMDKETSTTLFVSWLKQVKSISSAAIN